MKIFLGKTYLDSRGILRFNNDFDLSEIKRVYEIENCDIEFRRGWKGHCKEKRWFLCTSGVIEITVKEILQGIKLSNKSNTIKLSADKFDVLEVPEMYATLIKQKVPGSKVLVFANSFIDNSEEDIRWPYCKNNLNNE